MLDLDRGGARAAFIAALLAATFLLTAFLASRAQFAALYHRATAERVVNDWSAVAADELMRRVENNAGYNGTYPVLQSMVNDAHPPQSPLVVHTFRCNLAGGSIEVSPGTSGAMRDWLAAHVPSAAAQPATGGRAPLFATIDGSEHAFVYLVANESAVGFEVDRGAFGPYVAEALKRPLLPKSLAAGKIGNDAILVHVVDPSGRVIYKPAETFQPRVTHRVHDGLLRGFRADVAIAPRVAPLLVFGGLPASPRRLYATILGLTALLLITAALQLRKERALARMRSDFVASVSHELRTPLAQIRMFAETLLLDRVRSDDERKRSLAVIDQETRRLANVVENVLQFSRGERGTLRIAPHPCDLSAVVRETVELFAPIASARGVRVRVDAPEELIATVDEGAIRQIALNLLDNAVKYGPANQEVIVTLERAGGDVRLSVDDEGPGIPPRERRRVWSRYYRLGRERERAIAGAGIGLAVVRELVELHGGRARIEGGSRGGARVVVEIPA